MHANAYNARTQISGFVSRMVRRVALPAASRVLDIPSGYGRHAFWLADLGHHVTACDIDEFRIKRCRTAPSVSPENGSIHYVAGNAHGALPFKAATFDAAVIVHFVSQGLLERVATLLRPGGYLIYETFGGQGQNWLDLPKPGETQANIAAAFDLIHYRERPVGPVAQAVAVQLLARLKVSGGSERESA